MLSLGSFATASGMFIRFITTGGTIDKIYFDDLSQYEVGESQIQHILHEGLVDFDYEVEPLLHKDSLEMTDEDRQKLRDFIANDSAERFVVTHGTDTMPEAATALQGLEGKTIVLTGALTPARFKYSDAIFNVAVAVAAVQCLPPGVYLAMNGRVFSPDNVRKNRERNRFEPL